MGGSARKTGRSTAAASRERRWKAKALSYGLAVSNGCVFAFRCIRFYPRALVSTPFYELVFFFFLLTAKAKNKSMRNTVVSVAPLAVASWANCL